MDSGEVFPFKKITDHVSGSDNHILSFFLKHYIPTERLADIQGSKLFDSINKLVEEYQIEEHEALVAKTSIVVSGSAAEGLSVPVFYDRSTNREIWNSDFDMMRVMSDVVVAEPLATAKNSETNESVVGFIVPANHHGFVKITEKYNKSEGEASAYLPSDEWEVLKIVRELAKTVVVHEDFDIHDHGPALTTTSDALTLEMDTVYSYKCMNWPTYASNWLLRDRPSSWPSLNMIQEIAKDGCHVVAIGHPRSSEKHLEWRLSFSTAEKKLAHSLNLFQRKAYIILKILHRQHFSFPKIIATYHLKTTLFWVCEKLPNMVWCDGNMAACVYALLDQLLEYLSCHNIPNYFIASNNMLDHVHHDFITTMYKQVLKVRKNVMQSLLDFDKFYRLTFGPVKPWKVSLSLLSHPRMKTALEEEQVGAFSLILADLANMYTANSGKYKGAIHEAMYCLKESWIYQNLVAVFDKKQRQISLIHNTLIHVDNMFNSMCFQPTLNSISALLNLLDEIVLNYQVECMSKNDRMLFSSLCSFAGILHHCRAFWNPTFDSLPASQVSTITSTEKDESLQKAETHLIMASSLNSAHLLEKAMFMYQVGRFEEARHDLEEKVTSGDFQTFQITKVELPTLEKCLGVISKEHLNTKANRLLLPGIIVTYYYLCLTYLSLNNSEKAKEAFQVLSACCQDESIEDKTLSQKLHENISNKL